MRPSETNVAGFRRPRLFLFGVEFVFADIVPNVSVQHFRRIQAVFQTASDVAGADVEQRGLEQVQRTVLQCFAQPAVQFARGLCEAAAVSVGNGDVGLADQCLPFFPGVQFEQAVHAQQPPQFGRGKLLAENLHGIEGVGGTAAHDVAVADGKAGVGRRSQFGHGQAVFGRGLRAVFVVGVARREEDDAVEFEFVGECAGDVGVPFVYRVEGAAEKADARTHAGFTAHSVLPSTMRASLPVVGWMTRPCTGM